MPAAARSSAPEARASRRCRLGAPVGRVAAPPIRPLPRHCYLMTTRTVVIVFGTAVIVFGTAIALGLGRPMGPDAPSPARDDVRAAPLRPDDGPSVRGVDTATL